MSDSPGIHGAAADVGSLTLLAPGQAGTRPGGHVPHRPAVRHTTAGARQSRSSTRVPAGNVSGSSPTAPTTTTELPPRSRRPYARVVRAEQLADLLGGCGERLGRPRAVGYQRGRAPQRSLLIGKLAHPWPIDQTMARSRVDALTRILGARRIHKADGNFGPGGRQCWRQVPWLTRGEGRDGYSGQAEFSMMSTKLARW
jgi:hypothetical protein